MIFNQVIDVFWIIFQWKIPQKIQSYAYNGLKKFPKCCNTNYRSKLLK